MCVWGGNHHGLKWINCLVLPKNWVKRVKTPLNTVKKTGHRYITEGNVEIASNLTCTTEENCTQRLGGYNVLSYMYHTDLWRTKRDQKSVSGAEVFKSISVRSSDKVTSAPLLYSQKITMYWYINGEPFIIYDHHIDLLVHRFSKQTNQIKHFISHLVLSVCLF